MSGAVLLASGLALILWRPCREREGRAPRAAVALLLLSSVAVWVGSFAVAVQFAAETSQGAWTACGLLWQQIVNGQVEAWRVLPLAAWVVAFGLRGVVGLTAHQVGLTRLGRELRLAATPVDGSDDVLMVAGLGTPALALGVLRPTILVDRDFWTRASAAARAVILAHERAHARGRHVLIESAATFLVAPLRPLPLADRVYECVRRHLEAIADDGAVRAYGRDAVGRALGHIALEAFPAAGLGASGACVWRVKRLLVPTDELVGRDRSVMAAMVLMMAVMIIVAGAETALALASATEATFCLVPT